MIPVSVECYSGHTYAQEPRVIVWRGFRAPITGVEQTWYAPDGPIFRVLLERGARVDLHYVEQSDEWLLIEHRPVRS